jgi:precorrin-6Y C5,15-methyltransferase (decarboxylating)
MRRAVVVVGIGEDGCAGLSARAASAVASAHVLVGGERQLEFFPQFRGERIVLKAGISAAIERVAELAEEHNVCVLASGDPLFFGVGALIVRKLGAEHVEIVTQPSSVQQAFARVGIAWQDATFVSVHGRAIDGVAVRLRRTRLAAVLTDEENSPARIAAHLGTYGHASEAWRAWVCEDLGGAAERVRTYDTLGALAADGVACAPLNVLLLERRDAAWRVPAAVPHLAEEAYAKRIPKKGLITKREVRTLSLAALQLAEDATVWDIGAGSGSVAIEAAMLAPEGRVFAVEVDPEGVDICRENARLHGTDNVRVVAGLAPAALAALPAPDAVFVGGSKGAMDELVDVALARLTDGGRLVVNAVTLDNVAEAYQAFRRRDLLPEVTLVNVSRGEPLARYLRYEAQNPIHIFAVTKRAAATPPPEASR